MLEGDFLLLAAESMLLTCWLNPKTDVWGTQKMPQRQQKVWYYHPISSPRLKISFPCKPSLIFFCSSSTRSNQELGNDRGRDVGGAGNLPRVKQPHYLCAWATGARCCFAAVACRAGDGEAAKINGHASYKEKNFSGVAKQKVELLQGRAHFHRSVFGGE